MEPFCKKSKIMQSGKSAINKTVINSSSTSTASEILDNVNIFTYENRQRLRPIVESIIFMVRQNVALQEKLDYEEDIQLKYSIDDYIIKKTIKHGRNGNGGLSEYFNNTHLQNNLIEICGKQVQYAIIDRIRESKYYSIELHEVSDTNSKSLLSVYINYVHAGMKYEDFFGFVEEYQGNVSDAEIIGQRVLDKLRTFGIDLSDCIGIGIDDCRLSISEQMKLVDCIQKEAENAIRFPNFKSALNFSILKSSNVDEIRDSIEAIEEVIYFLNESSERMEIFVKICGKRCKTIFETSCMEKIEFITDFVSEFRKIVQTLDEITLWEDSDGCKASTLTDFLLRPTFLMCLHSHASLLDLFAPLANIFLKDTLHSTEAKKIILTAVDTIERMKEDCDEDSCNIFNTVSEICEMFDIPQSNSLDYLKKSIYIPMLDDILMDIKIRFSNDCLDFLDIDSLIPTNLLKYELPSYEIKKRIEIISEKYRYFLINKNDLNAEILSLKTNLEMSKDKYSTVEEAFINLDSSMYPQTHNLMGIYMTLPSNFTSAKRFSAFQRLKTHLEKKINHHRLSGLALLDIHIDIPIDVDRVIHQFLNNTDQY